MRQLGLILILATLLAGLAITFADDIPKKGDAPAQPDHQEHGRDRDRDRDRSGDDHRGGPPPAEMPPLTPGQIDEALAIMREISPWWADRMEEARQEDEQRFIGMLTRSYPRVRQFLELKQQDPPLFKLRIEEARLDSQSRRLSWQLYRAQADGDKEAAARKQELMSVLAEQFEVAQAARQHEIDTLKARLGDLEGELENHRTQRDALIQARYDELLAGAEHFDRRRQRDHDDGDTHGDRPERAPGEGERAGPEGGPPHQPAPPPDREPSGV